MLRKQHVLTFCAVFSAASAFVLPAGGGLRRSTPHAPSNDFVSGGHQTYTSCASPPSSLLGAPLPRQRKQERRRRHSLRLFASSSNVPSDCYAVLGLEPSASEQEIKRAYRRMATKVHPDVNKAPDAQERFAEVIAAYETLKDPQARAKHDRQRRGGGGWWGATSSSPSSSSASSGYAGSYSDRQRARDAASKNRREPEYERPEDIDDSLGSIFGDLLGGIARGAAVGAAVAGGVAGSRRVSGVGGVLEDLVDFLEQRVEGFGAESSPEDEDLLRSGSARELQQELDAGEALEAALASAAADAARRDADAASARAAFAAAEAAKTAKTTKDLAGYEREAELAAAAASAKARKEGLQGHRERTSRRVKRIRLRLAELGPVGSGGGDGGGGVSGAARSEPGVGREGGGEKSGTGGGGGYRSAGVGSGANERRPPAAGKATTGAAKDAWEPPHKRSARGEARWREVEVQSELDRLKRDMGL